MIVLEGADTALVLMESTLDAVDKAGADVSTVRRSTYVFRKSEDGQWLCAIDNSYGTDLLNVG
jgi:ketosteroid isomerase-like protein